MTDKHSIQVFTLEREFLRMSGRHGEGRGELKKPWGLAIDACDRVYVSECVNDCVTAEGQFVTSFGSKEKKLGQFQFPAGLAVDSSGVVYVCDHWNSRVQLF